MIFRNCDFTFGQGSSSVDELSWFSSSPVIYGSEDIFPPGLLSASSNFVASDDALAHFIPQDHFLPDNNSAIVVGDANDRAGNVLQEQFDGCARNQIKSTHTEVSNENGFTRYEDTDMIRMHKKLKRHPLSLGKEGGQASKHETTSSCSVDQMAQFVTSDDLSCQPLHSVLDPSHFWPSDASINLQNFITPLHQDQSRPTTSSIMCDNDNSLWTSRSHDCFTSRYDQLCPEKAPDHFAKPPDMLLKEMAERPCVGLRSHAAPHVAEHVGSELPAIVFDSSTLFEVPYMTCSGDIVKGINILQLQEVMNQLDAKTKICIRDGLHRLAESAEQRQKAQDRISRIRRLKE